MKQPRTSVHLRGGPRRLALLTACLLSLTGCRTQGTDGDITPGDTTYHPSTGTASTTLEPGGTEVSDTAVSSASAIHVSEPASEPTTDASEADTATDAVTTLPETPLTAYRFSVDPTSRDQTLKNFGGSGGWWAQDVGTWTRLDQNGREVREAIVELLFDPVRGIGLTAYRHNLGGGSQDSEEARISDPWRRAETMEVAPGEYDWSKDAGAQWVLHAACDAGVEEVVLFMNSAPERMKHNGRTVDEDDHGGNFKLEMAQDYAIYGADIAEHYLAEGLPIRYLSPVNEPSWPWTGGQEGTKMTPKEVVTVYEAYAEEMASRETLREVGLSGPEIISVGDDARRYVNALMRSPLALSRMDHMANHVYGSDAAEKKMFGYWFRNAYPDYGYRMSEWTEMVNGRDNSMDSGLVLAQAVIEDMTLLHAEAWQYWILVSKYDYHDGLIYVDDRAQTYAETKRLWTLGNFSKYTRTGDVRVATEIPSAAGVESLAFESASEDRLTVILVNAGEAPRYLKPELPDKYTDITYHVTSRTRNLETVDADTLAADCAEQSGMKIPTVRDDLWYLPADAVLTVVLTRP